MVLTPYLLSGRMALAPTYWQVSALKIQTRVVWASTLLTQTLRSVFRHN